MRYTGNLAKLQRQAARVLLLPTAADPPEEENPESELAAPGHASAKLPARQRHAVSPCYIGAFTETQHLRCDPPCTDRSGYALGGSWQSLPVVRSQRGDAGFPCRHYITANPAGLSQDCRVS